jgi:predicted carbohydrate-binding protein with CBM5 and CBM33 domain
MKTISSLVLPLLVFASCVAAHGYVSILSVDGTQYNGQEPTEDGQPTNPSVVRRISTINPVKGANNPFVNCGQSASAASLVAPANPGSTLTFQWEAGGGEGVSLTFALCITARRLNWGFSGHIILDHLCFT